jgi:hypothetical protein
VGVDVDRLACPLHHPTAYSCQMRGQGLLSGIILSRRCSRWWRLCGDVKPPGLGYLVESWPPRYLCYQVLDGVYCFYHDMFTLCQSHYGIYACTPGGATIRDRDGMDPSTRVGVV